MEENLDSSSTVKPSERSDDRQTESNVTQYDDKGPPKKAMKRKKDTQNSTQDLDRNVISHASANEALQQPKKKKKKKHTANDFHDDKISVEVEPSGHNLNTAEEFDLSENTGVKEKNVIETQNMVNNSEVPETAAEEPQKKKKKKKKKGNKQPTSDMTSYKKKATHDNPFFEGISDTRLAAYGENPKKIKNKVKYRKQES